MGHKSTLHISRHECLEQIKETLGDSDNIANETLAEMFEAMLGGEEHGHNYVVMRIPLIEKPDPWVD